MNYFALLLLAAVAAPPSSVSAKSVLSMALDLLPDLQAIIASTPDSIKESARVDGSNVEGVSRAFTIFIPIVRNALYAKAQQEQTEVDPQTIDTLDRVERLVPGMINLVGAISSGSPLGIDQEFLLPDFTKQILGTGAGNAPTGYGVEGETAATYTAPEVPTAPKLPTYTAPQVPVFPAPQVSTLVAAQVPAVANLQAPVATVPSQYDFDAAYKTAKERGSPQSADGVVSYALPGGGFFYATGY